MSPHSSGWSGDEVTGTLDPHAAAVLKAKAKGGAPNGRGSVTLATLLVSRQPPRRLNIALDPAYYSLQSAGLLLERDTFQV